jgi:hypothetical protein
MIPSRTFLPAAAIAATLIAAAAPAAADMFVWKDPETGRTRMSNIPPPFLREPPPSGRAPKVEVIRDRKVIDAATAFSNPQPPATPSERQLAKARPETVIKPAAAPVENDSDDDDDDDDR